MSDSKRTLIAAGVTTAFLLHLATLAVGLPWAYTLIQVEAAKARGIYATPEEGMEALLRRGRPDVERIEIESARPNWSDARLPPVWYATGRAWVSGPKARPQGYGGGSFFIRVHEGWVHVPEGCFPELIGLGMAVFGIS